MVRKALFSLSIAIVAALAIEPLSALPQQSGSDAESHRRPNVVIIVADDLGYSDLGSFGGEIETPNLDRLAKAGVKFTGFYTSPTCSPTRAMLLTGRDNHEVGLGTMGEIIIDQQRGRPGYEGYLTERAATLAERLHAAGYQTFMSGKWHLGAGPGQTPDDRGFERSFALLQGAHNHFGADQTTAYTSARSAPQYRLNGRAVKYPVGAYSSDYFTSQMINFVRGADKNKPFFAYMAYTAPHWPLQAPREAIAKYRGRYDDGPEALRDRRLARMKDLGIVPSSIGPAPLTGAPWSEVSPQVRKAEARKMETYAGMVDRLDENVGRLLQALEQSGQLDKTIVIFMSDNGAEGLVFERPVNLGDPAKSIDTPIDNRAENIGNFNSYVSYGPAWAQAGSSPYRGVKGSTTEGGIHSPAFISGPGIRAGRSTGALLHVTDVAPTVLALAGVAATETVAGRNVLPPEGRSWAPLVLGKVNTVRSSEESVKWELFFQRAIRRGNMKAVYLPNVLKIFGGSLAGAKAQWQLYDLATDPGERHDLAAERPELLRSLIAEWETYARDKDVVVLDDAPGAPSRPR